MTDAAPPTAPPRRLTRSTSDRMIAGVCGGLGEYTGLDPVIFRVVLAVATIMGGAGLLAYGLAWLVIPKADQDESRVSTVLRDRDVSRTVMVVVGALAVLVIAGMLDGPFHPRWGGGGLVLIALVGLGVWLWTREERPPAGTAAPVLPASTGAAPRPMPPRQRSRLFVLTMSALLVATGVLTAVDLAGGAEVSAGTLFATWLIVVGAGLLLGAWYGRSRGLIVVGALLVLPATAASVAHIPLRGGVGERDWRPATVDELRREYRLSAGEAVLDLRDVDFGGSARRIDVELGMGELRVWLPDGPDEPDVEVAARAGMGEVVLLGRHESGMDVSRTARIDGSGPGRLVLDLDVGMGRVEVRS